MQNNGVCRLIPECVVGYDVEKGVFMAPEQRVRCVDAGHLAVVGLAPADLTEEGEVLAIGTWEFAGTDGYNGEFLANLMNWLTPSATMR